MTALALHLADRARDAALCLDPLHLEAIRLGAGAATKLGMASARDAAASGHELWTAALLVHEVAGNPLWQAGRPRPAAAVTTALAAARRLTDAALARLAAEPSTVGTGLPAGKEAPLNTD